MTYTGWKETIVNALTKLYPNTSVCVSEKTWHYSHRKDKGIFYEYNITIVPDEGEAVTTGDGESLIEAFDYLVNLKED